MQMYTAARCAASYRELHDDWGVTGWNRKQKSSVRIQTVGKQRNTLCFTGSGAGHHRCDPRAW